MTKTDLRCFRKIFKNDLWNPSKETCALQCHYFTLNHLPYFEYALKKLEHTS